MPTSSLKITIVSRFSRAAIGGLPTYTRMLSRTLMSAGYQISSAAQEESVRNESIEYAPGRSRPGQVIDGLSTALIGPRDGWPNWLLRRLRHVTNRPHLRRIAPFVFNRAYRGEFAAHVPNDADVLHYIGTGLELLGFATENYARRSNAVFTIWPAVHPGTWGDSPLDIDLYCRADAVFCQSDHEVQYLASLGVPRAKLVRAWLAASVPDDGDGQRFRERYGLHGRPVILYIARKVQSKGFHALAEAMNCLVKQVPTACLIALGPDGDRPYPSMPESSFIDLGPADDATKADALAACDVFCMPSSAESFGIVYTEAWSYGKPVVGGPAPAVLELINGGAAGIGEAGIALDTQEPAAIADALATVLCDRELREQLGAAGAKLARNRYNWTAVRDLHLETFRRLRSKTAPC